jgi:7-cyano-7-deazaguanine synthase in queuosine biosynthesis
MSILLRAATDTCYPGDREHRNDWACSACLLRAEGFSEWKAA